MGKLDEILARNRRAHRPRERAFVGIVIGLFILVIIGLAAFTDLGDPPPDEPPTAPAPRDRPIHVPLGSPHKAAAGHGAQ